MKILAPQYIISPIIGATVSDYFSVDNGQILTFQCFGLSGTEIIYLKWQNFIDGTDFQNYKINGTQIKFDLNNQVIVLNNNFRDIVGKFYFDKPVTASAVGIAVASS